MAQMVNVNFKMDADVKKKMESVCAAMGLSMSAAFTIFAKKVASECKNRHPSPICTRFEHHEYSAPNRPAKRRK